MHTYVYISSRIIISVNKDLYFNASVYILSLENPACLCSFHFRKWCSLRDGCSKYSLWAAPVSPWRRRRLGRGPAGRPPPRPEPPLSSAASEPPWSAGPGDSYLTPLCIHAAEFRNRGKEGTFNHIKSVSFTLKCIQKQKYIHTYIHTKLDCIVLQVELLSNLTEIQMIELIIISRKEIWV